MRHHLIKLFQYSEWANDRILMTLESHPHDEALRLMNHILGAQDIWLSRIDPDFTGDWPLQGTRPIAECRAGNRHSTGAWIAHLGRIDDETLEATIHYKNLAGAPFENRLKDLVTHVLNHGTHHRAQISTLIRQGGGTPPGTDYIYYLRESA